MVALAAITLFALTVKTDLYPLRSGCSPDDAVIAKLRAGQSVEIRFAFAGEGETCYKIAATVNGKPVEGFAPASALTGLEQFEAGRRSARTLDLPQMLVGKVAQRTPGAASDAARLIRANQPGEALDPLERQLLNDPHNAQTLALAGLAAYQADHVSKALDYWQQSLAIQADPDLERLYRKAQREAAGDHSNSKTFGTRFVLRYDDTEVTPEAARTVVQMLEEEYSRVSAELGCSTPERIPVIVQNLAAYRKTTDAAEWSGGQYDGQIHVALLDAGGVGPATRRALTHELVHACLADLGNYPAWLHEGLAQRISGETLSPRAVAELHELIRERRVPKLSNMSQAWSRMSTGHALAAYALSLTAVDLFFENYSQYGIRNLLRNPELLPQVTIDLDRRLGL